MKYRAASLSIAWVRLGPPLPPAPALQMIQSGFTVEMILEAEETLWMSSREDTRVERWLAALDPAALSMSSFCEALRMRDVTCQLREMRSGVRRRDTLPWPPRRRMCGEDIDIVVIKVVNDVFT